MTSRWQKSGYSPLNWMQVIFWIAIEASRSES
jgi:hypothetical protein